MKKIIIILLILCGFCSVYSQDCSDMLDKKTLENHDLKNKIDSLNKTMSDTEKSLENQITQMQKKLDTYKDLARYKDEKKEFDAQLKQKNDSINLLKNQISDEKRKGEQEALANIINSYQNKKFDNLLKSSTKLSVQRDMQLVDNFVDVKLILSDLNEYFNAKELLAKKWDVIQIENALAQLNQIDQQSELLDKLKKNIKNYKSFCDGFREIIEKIIALDKRETVSDMSEEIQKQKLNKILLGLSSYIFNYDFNFVDYPYLSDIVLEIIKRKQPDADADITDLLGKL